MSEPWKPTTIRQCLVESFAGEWGGNPRPGNAKVLRATDIDDDGHVVGPGAIRQLPIGKLTAKRLLDGDILLEGSGGGPGKPVGRVAYFEADDHYEAAVCSNFFKTLRPMRSEVEPRFLLRKLAWFYKQPALLALQQQTTGIINLKFEEYLSAQIEIPGAIVEQQKLAQVLDTLDVAIRETNAIIAKLKAAKRGLLHDLLTRGIDVNGELRPPQAEAPHGYKQSPLGWIPQEWNAYQFEDLADYSNGNTFDAAAWSENGLPIIRIQNLNGSMEFNHYLGIVQSKWHVHPGDLLFAWAGQRGSSFGARIWDGPEGVLNQHIFKVLPREKLLSKNYLFRLLRFRQAVIEDAAHGFKDSFLHVTKKELGAVYGGVPTHGEQALIEERISSFEDKLLNEETGLQKLKRLKSGIMDDLLTGRVRVTPLLVQAAQQQGGS